MYKCAEMLAITESKQMIMIINILTTCPIESELQYNCEHDYVEIFRTRELSIQFQKVVLQDDAIITQEATYHKKLANSSLCVSSVCIWIERRHILSNHCLNYVTKRKLTNFKQDWSYPSSDNADAILQEAFVGFNNSLTIVSIMLLLLLLSGDIEENPGPLSKLTPQCCYL